MKSAPARPEFLDKVLNGLGMRSIQAKMARAGLKWTRDKLSEECGVSTVTISHFECGYYIKKEAVERIRRAFEGAGVELVSLSGRVSVSLPDICKNEPYEKKYISASMMARKAARAGAK